MPLWKRISLIVGFILFTLLIGYLIYRFFFSTREVEPTPTPQPTVDERGSLPNSLGVTPIQPTQRVAPTTQLPPTPIGEVATTAQKTEVAVEELEISNSKSPFLASDGKSLVTYDSFDGKFYRIKADGTPEPMASQTFKGAESVVWSPKTDKAAIKFFDDSNIIYDFEKQKQITLPKHWREFDFSPGGDKIAFKSLADNPDNRWLGIVNIDGTDAKLIEPLGRKAAYFNVSWSPSNQVVGTFREGIDGDRQMLYLIGKNNENFKSMVVEGRGLETEWSTRGDLLLYSVYSSKSDFKPEIWITEAIGESIGNNRQKIGIQTWAHKCTFADNETVYCAIPPDLKEGAGILPAMGDDGADSIYKIDLTTGIKEKVVDFPEKHTIDKIIISSDQSTLYFQEKYSNKLFNVKIN